MTHESTSIPQPQEITGINSEIPYSKASTLVTTTKQLYALEDGEDGVVEVSYENGVRVFDKDGFRYKLEYGNGIDVSLERWSLECTRQGLRGSIVNFMIALDQKEEKSYLAYTSTTFVGEGRGQPIPEVLKGDKALPKVKTILKPFYPEEIKLL